MGDYGDGLIDLGDASREEFYAAQPRLPADQTTRRIENAVDALMNRGEYRLPGRPDGVKGGIVYFPPGRYALDEFKYLRTDDRTGRDIYFAFDVEITLRFAPGAVLTLGQATAGPFAVSGLRRTDLVVGGKIDAGPWQIVVPAYGPDGALDLTQGRLILWNDQNDVVYPEWFGARSADAGAGGYDSFPGLQAAIDAAIHDRSSIRSQGSARFELGMYPVSPIPIELNGVYEISRPLTVGYGGAATGVEDRLRSFVFRSASDRSGLARATIRARPDFAATDVPPREEDATLLRVQGPTSFLVEGVEFDGADRDGVRRAFSCARVEVGQDEGKRGLAQPGGDAQLSRFRHCAFRRAKTVLLQLGELVDPFVPLPPGRLLWNYRQDLLGLQVVRCTFDHGDDLGGLDFRWWRDGVFFAASDAFELHFVDCAWRGRMRTGLRAFSGRASLTGCRFDLRRVTVPPDVVEAQGSRHAARPGEWSSPGLGSDRGRVDVRDNGCDLFIDYPLATGVELTGLFVRDCESRSWRCFATFAPNQQTDRRDLPYDFAKPSWDVQFTDLRVDPVSLGDAMADGWEVPPSMLWDFRGLGFGVTLTLNDVRLPGPAALTEALALDPTARERVHPGISGALLIAPGTPLPTTEPDALCVYDLGLQSVRGRLPAWYLVTGPLDDVPQPWYRVLGPRAVV